MRLATTESWRDKQSGERRERTEWHSVVIFNEQLSKIAQQYLKKGSKVYIEGQLQTRKWQDNSGNDRYTTEVVLQNYAGQLTMLDGRNGSSGFNDGGNSDFDAGSGGATREGSGFRGSKARSSEAPKSFEKDLDDEIPF